MWKAVSDPIAWINLPITFLFIPFPSYYTNFRKPYYNSFTLL